jgi:hypothetical protein
MLEKLFRLIFYTPLKLNTVASPRRAENAHNLCKGAAKTCELRIKAQIGSPPDRDFSLLGAHFVPE